METTNNKNIQFHFGTLFLPNNTSISTYLTTNNFLTINLQENNSLISFSFPYNHPIHHHKLYEKLFLYKNINNTTISTTLRSILKKYYFPLKPTLTRNLYNLPL